MFVLYSYDCSAHQSVMETLKFIGCSIYFGKLQEKKEALEEYCRLENSMINTYHVKYWSLCNNMTQTRYEKFPVVRGLTWTEWQQSNREKAYKQNEKEFLYDVAAKYKAKMKTAIASTKFDKVTSELAKEKAEKVKSQFLNFSENIIKILLS